MSIYDNWLTTKAIAKHGLFNQDYPEHSIGALQNAIDNKYPVMISVQALNDGSLICFSEKSLSRLTGCDGYISKINVSDLENVYLCKTQYKILTLEEALKFIDNRVPVLINIINDFCSTKMPGMVYDLMVKYPNDNYAIMSTNPTVVAWFMENAPTITRGIKSCKFSEKVLCSYKTKRLTKLKHCKECNPDFICYNAKLLPNRYVKKYKHLPLLAYSISSKSEYLEKVKLCDNVIFDSFTPSL